MERGKRKKKRKMESKDREGHDSVLTQFLFEEKIPFVDGRFPNKIGEERSADRRKLPFKELRIP